MTPDLSLVLPAYNESARLPAALERLRDFATVSGLVIECIVSDDGSDDDTAAIARAWPSTGQFAVRVVPIRHRGKGAAVRAGMTVATAPISGYSDVDLSAGPDAVALLYAKVKDGADVAIASRAHPESVLVVRQPWYRERAGHVFNFVLRKLARVPFRDTQCGLKLFRREAATAIFAKQRLDGFAFDAEVVVIALRLGSAVEEVPIRWSHAEGSKLSMVKDSFRMARDISRIVRRVGRGDLHGLGVPTAEAIDTMAAVEDRHWWYVTKRKLVRRSIRASGTSGPCLDVGCGGGAVLLEAGREMPVYGVDLSRRALQHAHSRGLDGLVEAEGGRMPFAEKTFGVVLALDVIEHHAQPELLIRDIRRVTAPGGALIVTVPAYQWMWSYADHVLGHYRRYTRQRLESDLRGSGFVVERMTHFHSWVLAPAWLFRRLRSLLGRTESADDFPVPGALNRLLRSIGALELRYLDGRDLPFGLSILAVARRAPEKEPLSGVAAQMR
jgi:glycosyltransferase involved in cell wall biosynthesis